MLTLPLEQSALVAALASHLREADAGLLLAEHEDDPDALDAALDEASLLTGHPILKQWLDHGRRTLAWLKADDVHLKDAAGLCILGVEAPADGWRDEP